MKTTKMKFEVSNGRILKKEKIDNNSYKITIETEPDKNVTEIIVKESEEIPKGMKFGKNILIEASKISLNDELLKYEPFKSILIPAIRTGKLEDFYVPGMDPSFDGRGGICYSEGKRPAVGKSYVWWSQTARNFMPYRNSRLGTKVEYVAFLWDFVNRLQEKGYSLRDALRSVRNDSRKLGHFWNSAYAVHKFERTGSRTVCGYSDLGNTYKILQKDKNLGCYIFASGYYNCTSTTTPISEFFNDFGETTINYSVGWIVCS